MLNFSLYAIYEYETNKFKEVRVGLGEGVGIVRRLAEYDNEEQTAKVMAEGFCSGYAMAKDEVYVIDWYYLDEIVDVTLVERDMS